jgi:hypothetical protein
MSKAARFRLQGPTGNLIHTRALSSQCLPRGKRNWRRDWEALAVKVGAFLLYAPERAGVGRRSSASFTDMKRFDATKIHTYTFSLDDLPTALHYAKDRIDDAIKVVVKTRAVVANEIAAR